MHTTPYENKAAYACLVQKQELCQTKDGFFQVVLTVVPAAKLNDQKGRNIKAGSTPLPEALRCPTTLRVSFKDAERAFKDLYRYGMPSPGKVSTLSPDHPNHFSLVGKTVYAQIVYKPSNRDPEVLEDSWWLTWYNEPAAVSLADLEKFEKDNEEILANAALAAMGDTF
jgi:hypothetical protein